MAMRVKGTQDFLDLTLFNFLIDQAKKHLATYSFTEIMTPVIEPLELFRRSLGLQTDVITKEMYLVTTGKESPEDTERLCLRPEFTAPVVRAFIDNGVDVLPWKVFTHGPLFRHERPQKGRYREFHQISVEIIGSHAIAQDAYLITMLDRFFQEVLKLDTYALLINFLGCHADQENFKLVLARFLEEHKGTLCDTCIERKEKNIMRVFDCKSPACQVLFANAPRTADYLCSECAHEWTLLQQLLQQLSVSFSYMPTLVRGLDYYTKTVFEFVSASLGAQNTFCGGGRYDKLVREIGGQQDQPSVGAAMGIERLLLMLGPLQDRLALAKPVPLHCILPIEPEQLTYALLLADELHAQNVHVTPMLEGGSLKSMLRRAHKLGAVTCLIIGQEEQAEGVVTIKNMASGQEHRVKQREAAAYLKNISLQQEHT